MISDIEKTSFCGLFCADCIPSNNRLFELAQELNCLLKDTNFQQYADFKSNKVLEFKDYDIFVKVLNSFEKIHCYQYCRKGPCSEAGCAQSCKIRVCSIEKKIEGCWDCDEYTTCEHIEKMERFHPDIKFNLSMIKEHGVHNWKNYRGKHYHWSSM